MIPDLNGGQHGIFMKNNIDKENLINLLISPDKETRALGRKIINNNFKLNFYFLADHTWSYYEIEPARNALVSVDRYLSDQVKYECVPPKFIKLLINAIFEYNEKFK